MASEYAGIASSNPLDGEVHLIDGTSTSITVGPLATSSAPDLLFACSMSDSGDVGSWTVGAGYTLRQFDTRDAAEDQFRLDAWQLLRNFHGFQRRLIRHAACGV